MIRTEQLKKDMLSAKHKVVRIAVPDEWSVADLPLSLPERKAEALCKILENMPLYIGDGELIVGSRTVYGHRGEEKDRSNMDIFALPDCINDEDIALYGTNEQMKAGGHFTPDYGIIVHDGIKGVLDRTYRSLTVQIDPDKRAFLRAVIRVYEGLSKLILRYAEYADESAHAAEGDRRKELEQIGANCRYIAYAPPQTFWQAVQLIWFSHLSMLIESFQFVSYGRLDQLLYPFSKAENTELEQQIIDCLVLKMYDSGDVVDSYFGTYSGQHTLTLGGVTPEGEDAVNPVTMMFLSAVARIGLPEPMVEIRYNPKNPDAYLRKAAEISVRGINTIAYYKDDLFIRNLKEAGFPEYDANNYGFGLCQDVQIPGKSTHFNALEVSMAKVLLGTLRRVPDDISFEELFACYREDLLADIDKTIDHFNRWTAGIAQLNAGNREAFLEKVRAGEIPLSWANNSPMAPLLLASALFEGCIEDGINLALYPYALPYKGMTCGNIVIGINSLAAVRKCAIEEKRFSISQIMDACDRNYEGEGDEVMRQVLWNAPKWGNDDPYVDVPARELLETCCRHISAHKTIFGTNFLAGIHQPHPVSVGWKLQATPEGRRAKEPVPVTLTPENGTILQGPTAILHSVSQLDDHVYHWNICLMLQFSSSVFEVENGVDIFCDMLCTYFAQGGSQLQPNIVNLKHLKEAQIHPEKYRDLVVRLWGVSVQFINLPREIQEEFMARFSAR